MEAPDATTRPVRELRTGSQTTSTAPAGNVFVPITPEGPPQQAREPLGEDNQCAECESEDESYADLGYTQLEDGFEAACEEVEAWIEGPPGANTGYPRRNAEEESTGIYMARRASAASAAWSTNVRSIRLAR
eukprot:293877-Pleurochrysis_carterae.AAC.1